MSEDLAAILLRKPSDLHKGAAGARASVKEVDIDEIIERSGCAKQYYLLEDCLGVSDRNWSKCQEQVKALKHCNSEKEQRTSAAK